MQLHVAMTINLLMSVMHYGSFDPINLIFSLFIHRILNLSPQKYTNVNYMSCITLAKHDWMIMLGSV